MATNTAHIAPTTPSLLIIDDIGLQINTDRRNAIIYKEFSS
jgi:DNA replication protein DnaC